MDNLFPPRCLGYSMLYDTQLIEVNLVETEKLQSVRLDDAENLVCIMQGKSRSWA